MRSGKARTGWILPLGLVVSLAVIVLSGCGPSGPKLVPVEGKVTLMDGSPIAHGYVMLHADASKGNTSKELPQGTIEDGSYKILTGARQGAPLGAYKIGISAAKDVNPNNPYITEWLAEERYVDPLKSNLTMEVVEKPEPGRYNFKLNPHRSQKK